MDIESGKSKHVEIDKRVPDFSAYSRSTTNSTSVEAMLIEELLSSFFVISSLLTIQAEGSPLSPLNEGDIVSLWVV